MQHIWRDVNYKDFINKDLGYNNLVTFKQIYQQNVSTVEYGYQMKEVHHIQGMETLFVHYV